MIPIRDKRTDISSEVAKGKLLKQKIQKLSEEAAKRSVEDNIDLDEVIAEISKKENFNRLEIQRMVEESNTISYNKRYDKLRAKNDRRITFPVASLDGVVRVMGEDAPSEITNPNLASGKKGSGEISKAASSIESSYIHNPNGKLDEKKEKYLKKVASVQQIEQEKERKKAERDYQSSIFKIANSLVMSERQYKNANEVFNTLLDDVQLDQDDIDGIKKKASEITDQMVKSKRSHANFMVTLEENSTEKVANHLLGEYSLLKVAESTTKVKEVKVQPTSDVTEYKQLIELARKLEQSRKEKTPVTTGSEVK